jgi:aminoglycoside/choline kinase family phosphotransferase
MSSERLDAIGAFLREAGWEDAERLPLAGDASMRRYDRLVRPSGGTAVLMDAPPAAEAPACPPGADATERKRLGYNAVARLAGPNPVAFAGIAQELSRRGYSAPKMLHADLDRGLLLLEDLGDDLFARVIERGAEAQPLYESAIDLLAAISRATFPVETEFNGRVWPLQDYDDLALQAEVDLLTEWYAPHRGGAKLDEAALAEWRDIWAEAFTALSGQPQTLVLRDYHAENLIWLPEREGPAQAGLIDFQDAVFGHPAYDLISLLQDARRDVDPALADAMYARFLDAAGVTDEAAFARAYAVLGAQRNAKILGIFVRLAHRDGKPKYLDLLPRVARLFLSNLTDPALGDLKAWVGRNLPALADEARR